MGMLILAVSNIGIMLIPYNQAIGRLFIGNMGFEKLRANPVKTWNKWTYKTF
ncbi:hypothetical protein DGWBC_0784 [Dehalogenimonas sp. WBC-2]|nr:hypothetical protein DGWBC_0784 [Dehalogenimonas sp. WBC-2]